MKVFDVRSNQWGHAIYRSSGNKVTGLLTPLPNDGDYAVGPDGQIFEFKNVNKWGNPRDGFDAEMVVTRACLDGDESVPEWEEIKAFLDSAND